MSNPMPRGIKSITVSAVERNWETISTDVRVQVVFDGKDGDGGDPTEMQYVWKSREVNPYSPVRFSASSFGERPFWLHNSVEQLGGFNSGDHEHKHYPEKDKPGLIYDPNGDDWYIQIHDLQGHYTTPTKTRPTEDMPVS